MCGHLYSGYMRNKIGKGSVASLPDMFILDASNGPFLTALLFFFPAAAKYNISEALCCSILTEMLCPYCSCYQYENEVLVKEKLTWGWCEVVSDVGGGGGGGGGPVAVLAGAPSRSEDMIR